MLCNGRWFKRHSWSKWKSTGNNGEIHTQGPGVLLYDAETRAELPWYVSGFWFEQERTCSDCGIVQRRVQKVKQ